jgi:pilus assembly protein CpaE
MQFVAIAVDSEDESELSKMNDVIKAAKAKKIKVMLIANQVSPIGPAPDAAAGGR